MKRAISAVMLAVLLAGCETNPQQAEIDPRFEEHRAWVSQIRPRAERGEIKWSAYYEPAFNRVSALPNYPFKSADLRSLNNLLGYAKRYESGEINAEQFEQLRRDNKVAYEAEKAQVRQYLDSQDEANRRAAIQMLGNRPPVQPITLQPYQVQPPQQRRTTNCSSYVSGGQLITNCQ